jgi:hypothetical protein
MNANWIRETRDLLIRWRGSGPGFGYRPQGDPHVEPTALVGLALAASIEPGSQNESSEVADAANWLAQLQHPDGSLGLSRELNAPHWPTTLAILLWVAARRHETPVRDATLWLLEQQGNTTLSSSGTPFGHDAAIAGWPWVAGTQSWVEPTALAILALRRGGHGDHPRVRAGLDLIRDRAIRTGGWNYGNSQVFGTDLRPQPGPTGLALLALAGRDDADSPVIRAACDYLARVVPATRAPQSLCFGLLALAAWNRRPAEAADWIEAARDKASQRSNRLIQVAYLLLAALPGSLELLGLAPSSWEG